jgi:hypothetical protein
MKRRKTLKFNANLGDRLVYRTNDGMIHLLDIYELKNGSVSAKGIYMGKTLEVAVSHQKAVVLSKNGQVNRGFKSNFDLTDVAIFLGDMVVHDGNYEDDAITKIWK